MAPDMANSQQPTQTELTAEQRDGWLLLAATIAKRPYDDGERQAWRAWAADFERSRPLKTRRIGQMKPLDVAALDQKSTRRRRQRDQYAGDD